jgi:dTDP-L-rhamnose 4-epimerase
MKKNILITGGAGFIGTNLTRKLLQGNHSVRVLDCFSSQIHASDTLSPDIANNVELIRGDIRDRRLLKQALKDIEVVVHLAAETGTGQSMYEIDNYYSVNVQGTAVLMDLITNEVGFDKLEKVVVASSRAIYGEGAYNCSRHGVVYPSCRETTRMACGHFEPTCPVCDGALSLLPTREDARLNSTSFYALTKEAQERAMLLHAQANRYSCIALRYQNVYGPGQSLKNPYTGILAIFSNLARQGHCIDIFEDGMESRDFVYIEDVIEATYRSITLDRTYVGALNVGSGVQTRVIDIAHQIIEYLKSDSQVKTTGAFRSGDIRHNLADTRLAEEVLGFKSKVDFKNGLKRFLDWAVQQPLHDTNAFDTSLAELKDRGLYGASNK